MMAPKTKGPKGPEAELLAAIQGERWKYLPLL